ncbi:hypothetical protein [Ferrimicrobium acidiphilum]|uniref:AP2-like integrase N-terminal domain-containing protein n=1 Tax=Ferrimicrobium acidiphilum DSM 19497 TaxID=1121877 RepID=A0A0D8FV64_9ACTN|nr:hypothetical protein [Ferrimicrobium acidiphilum]KJE77170.1 hypothetical protein FEAC_11030 [Ferrimicrobium acidiphilum DSM 19497]
MAGSIRLRRQPNVWELRVFVGRDANGKVKHRYSTFIGSKRDAERELARQLLLINEAPAPVIEVLSGTNELPSTRRSKLGRQTAGRIYPQRHG